MSDVPSDPEAARLALIKQLQRAHAGERAAWHAYHGHARAVWKKSERDEIEAIKDSEWEHRECVGAMLESLGGGPQGWREAALLTIGIVIHVLCR